MFYIDSDGKRKVPQMVHRALFGSLERFAALLIEHYKGEFPFWFSPVQFGIVPINEVHYDYCKKLAVELKSQGFRIEVNFNNVNMRDKIKGFQLDKIPYILVIGDREIENSTFSVRSRNDGNLGAMNIHDLFKYLMPQIEMGNPKRIIE